MHNNVPIFKLLVFIAVQKIKQPGHATDRLRRNKKSPLTRFESVGFD
jgi:hypothetical protein